MVPELTLAASVAGEIVAVLNELPVDELAGVFNGFSDAE